MKDSWSMEFYAANALTGKQDVPALQEITATSLHPDEVLSTDTKAIGETTERSSPANHEQLIQFPEEPVDELVPSPQSTNPNPMTSINRKPPEQCEYFSHRRTERNLHKTTDLFSHGAHEYSNPAARYKSGHPRHSQCKQCYTAHCFDDRCWNPAKHRATLRKHPQLRDKEREDSFAVDKARAQARAWAAMQEIHTKPMVSYDYVLLSDDSDNEEESEESEAETLAAEDEEIDEHISTLNYEEYTDQDTMDER
ncbi:hypothetical protein LTR05_004064 [Lithohypha guttulata]|uniref:Uncharacterized protein n=1 Tax=Lithohypha guttulata TaxID=1690604 RepID=A0AAN7YI12_9EURO|nr:hypothetical protein LTR05_004064 [Lithohypha guttulata]